MTWDWSESQRAALEAFLAERGLCEGSLTTTPIGDGHSNLTFLATDGRHRLVVRRGPVPPIPPGAHDMLRESTLIAALSTTPVPVPQVLAVCRAGPVIDVPFYVMSHIEGSVVTTSTPSAFHTREDRRRIGEVLITTLAAIHAVDWRAAGLGDFGRPDNFNQRHFQRMGQLVADDDGNPPPGFSVLDDWIGSHVPTESGATILHNDYRVGNVILAPNPPVRILAVLDWELATIGDPLFDLGYFLASYPVRGEPLTPTMDMSVALLEEGYPPRQELAALYASLTGRDLTNLTWYMALSLWKLAVLYEYGRRRAVTGRGDRYYEDPALVRSFLAAAHRVAGLSSAD